MDQLLQVIAQSAEKCWNGVQYLYTGYVQPAVTEIGNWITGTCPWLKDIWDILYSTAAQIMKVRYQVKIVMLAIMLPYIILTLGRRRRRRRW